jgi:hypothetical protein
VIADYVSGKLQTLADHFQTAEPNQFAYLYNKWGESNYPLKTCQVLPTERIKRSRSN